uniref:Mur ligase domain-containing protein n=1 Tax=Alistipes putredinis TaxID=28117 RepID=UPI003FD71D95
MKEFSNVFDERGELRICSDSAEPEKQRMQFNVYFLGIGGIGMSALARYFLHEGRRVAGYDRVQ